MPDFRPENDEYASVEALVEFLIEEDLACFDYRHLTALRTRLHRPARELRRELESYGLKLAPRPKGKKMRGHTTNDNDRWYGPGSSPTHGGSGWEQINGMSGQTG